ncbi:MAG TPA: hypothetical protein VL424_09190 [Pararobbsia sp.]|nr:hypothetical protein [Pararobbsia sp.]
MKTKLLAALGAGALLLAGSQAAMAGVALGLNFGVPGYVAPAPAYVAPAPVYVAPAPVYAPPAPVVAYQAAPVVAPSVYIGWHSGRYWDGHRWWSRGEWYGHRRW